MQQAARRNELGRLKRMGRKYHGNSLNPYARRRMCRRRRFGGFFVALCTVGTVELATACKPRLGGKCTPGQATCQGDRSGLFCSRDGAYRSLDCRGRDGCQQEGARVTCDQSIAAVDDACTTPGFACTADKKNALSCQGGKFAAAQTCSGPFGCRTAPYDGFAPGGSGNILCDNDVASVGDPCLDEGDYACTSDRSLALRCSGKKMVIFRECDVAHCSVAHRTSKETDIECEGSNDD
jgi:hypothetical protein